MANHDELRKILESINQLTQLREMPQRIELCQQALELINRSEQSELWAALQNVLAHSFLNNHFDDWVDNLEQAILHYSQALEVYTRQTYPVPWADTQNNLAAAYYDRIRGERAENLEQAILHYSQALEVYTRQTYPEDWAMTQNNLALAYSKRIRGERADNIEQAILHYSQALEVRTRQAYPEQWADTQNNLAAAYSYRISGERVDNIEQAILHYSQALKVYTRQVYSVRCLSTTHALGQIWFNRKDWSRAIEYLRTAIDCDQDLFQVTTLRYSKEAQIESTGNLYLYCAYALVQSGDLPAAVETIESGRARLLNEALQRRDPDISRLEKAHPDLSKQYLLLADEIVVMEAQEHQTSFNISPTPVIHDLSQRIRIARDALQDLITHIRQLPDFEKFLKPFTFSEIAALGQDIPLVYLLVTSQGGMALLVRGKQVSFIPLENLTEKTLYERVLGNNVETNSYFVAYDAWRIDTTNKDRQWDYCLSLQSITGWLWATCMGKVVEKLKSEGISQAMLVPSGLLGLLPLHAAWMMNGDKRHYALDDVCIHYIPSTAALRVSILAAQLPKSDLLAVDSLDPTKHISMVLIDYIRQFFESSNTKLVSYPQGKEAVLQKLDRWLVHFSCHGLAGFVEPLKSSLTMPAGEPLYLEDILTSQHEVSRQRMAVLSACETAIPGTKLLDEVISLPAGLMQAGFAGVVASQWLVDDLAAALLLAAFYENWLGKNQSPAAALRNAQIWLRDAEEGALCTTLEHLEGLAMSDEVWTRLKSYREEIQSSHLRFDDPFFWAAFGFYGL